MINPNLYNEDTELIPRTDERRVLADADAIEEMKEMAQRQIEAAAHDPTVQNYFLRTDTKTIIKTEEEYDRCVERGTPLKIVPYSVASSILQEEDARKRAKALTRKKQKAARKARKRNRS